MNKEQPLYPCLDIQTLCRLCLSENIISAVEIFPSAAKTSGQMSIPMRIMACSALEVQPGDGLPKTICSDCRYQLEKFYYFRKRSQLADSKFRKHIRLLSQGKKSRVFVKAASKEDDDDDELEEFADSLSFLQEHDDRRLAEESKQNEEAVKNLKMTLKAWEKKAKQRREEIRAEVRSSVATEVKKELRSEVRAEVQRECVELAKKELRSEVEDNCHRQERAKLLNDMEKFLIVTRCRDKILQKHVATGEVRGETSKKSKETQEGEAPVATWRNLKRRATAPLATTKQKHHKKLTSLRTSAVESEEMVLPICGTDDASPPAEEEESVAENAPNFYIVEESDEDEVEQHPSEEHQVEAVEQQEFIAASAQTQEPEEDEALFISENDAANFRLTASDNTQKETTYQIGHNGEIQFSNNETTESSDDEENTNDENTEESVINFDHDNAAEGEQQQIDLVEFVSMDKSSTEAMADENPTEETQQIVEGNGSSTSATEANEVTLSVCFSPSTASSALAADAALVAAASIETRVTDTPKTFHCGSCPIVFSMESALERHQRTHLKSKETGVSHMCPECLIYVSCRSALRRHMLIHTGVRKFACDTCGKSFVQREVLKRHQETHTGERRFKCLHCDRAYTQKVNLLQHVNLKHMVAPPELHTCHLCPKRFHHASGLSRHLTTHSGVAYQCTECDRTFGDRSSVKRHIANIHGNAAIDKTSFESFAAPETAVAKNATLD